MDGNVKHGIGWSDEGIDKYNELYDMVAADRAVRGPVFNNELLNVFRERRAQRNKRPAQEQRTGKKQRSMPKDDMQDFDITHSNAFSNGATMPDCHPSAQI